MTFGKPAPKQDQLSYVKNLGNMALPWCFWCGDVLALYIEKNSTFICFDCRNTHIQGPSWR